MYKSVGSSASGASRPGPVAGLGAAAASKGGFHVAVGFSVGMLGAVARRVGHFDEAPAVEHKGRPPAVGDEPPRPVDLAEEGGYCRALFLVSVARLFQRHIFSRFNRLQLSRSFKSRCPTGRQTFWKA